MEGKDKCLDCFRMKLKIKKRLDDKRKVNEIISKFEWKKEEKIYVSIWEGGNRSY